MCEVMASLVCDTSTLKATGTRLKGKSFSHKVCTKWQLGITKSIKHIVMQCPFYNDIRVRMYKELSGRGSGNISNLLKDSPNIFFMLLGKHLEHVPLKTMVDMWLIPSKYITRMYTCAITGRQ